MSEPLLTDEVWAALDPAAGRLTRRDARRWVGAIGLGVVLTTSAFGAWYGGVVVPRVSARLSGWSTDSERHRFTYLMRVRNDGIAPVEIRRVGRSGPGLTLLSVNGLPPAARIASFTGAGSVDVELAYEVTDCGAVPTGSWPIPLQVKNSWGTHTIAVQPGVLTWPDAPAGTWSYSGADPNSAPWQRVLANVACRPASGTAG